MTPKDAQEMYEAEKPQRLSKYITLMNDRIKRMAKESTDNFWVDWPSGCGDLRTDLVEYYRSRGWTVEPKGGDEYLVLSSHPKSKPKKQGVQWWRYFSKK